MSKFYDTFYNPKNVYNFPKKNLFKLIYLKDGSFAGLTGCEFAPSAINSIIVYNEHYQTVSKADLKDINDIIEINNGEILALSEKKYIYIFKQKNFQLMKKIELDLSKDDESSPNNIMKFSNGDIILFEFWKTIIRFYEIYEKDNLIDLKLVNNFIENSYLYDICETNNNQFA